MNNLPNAVLIFPHVYSDYTKKESNLAPPLGLLSVAGVLLKHGFEITIIDQRVDNDWEFLLHEALKKKPLFAGISAMTCSQLKHTLKIGAFIRHHSDVPIVCGGVHPTLAPETIACEDVIDIAVVGEGEDTMAELLEYFKGMRELRQIDGLAFKSDQGVIITPQRKPVDMDSIPFTPFHLLNLQKYAAHAFFGFNNRVFLPLETSRGCSHRCAFCRESVQKSGYRGMSPERALEHIDKLVADYGINAIAFYDDNFFANANRAERILDLILEKQVDIEWYANAHPKFIKKFGLPMVKKIRAAGCKSLSFGADSGNDEILHKLGKGMTINELFEVNKIMAAAGGLKAMYTFIQGFPYDTIQTINETMTAAIHLVQANPYSRVDINKLIPMPATRILEECIKKGYKEPKTALEWSFLFDNNLLAEAIWLETKVYKWMKKCAYVRIALLLRNIRYCNKIFRLVANFILNLFLFRQKHNLWFFWVESHLFSILIPARLYLDGLFSKVSDKIHSAFQKSSDK